MQSSRTAAAARSCETSAFEASGKYSERRGDSSILKSSHCAWISSIVAYLHRLSSELRRSVVVAYLRLMLDLRHRSRAQSHGICHSHQCLLFPHRYQSFCEQLLLVAAGETLVAESPRQGRALASRSSKQQHKAQNVVQNNQSQQCFHCSCIEKCSEATLHKG